MKRLKRLSLLSISIVTAITFVSSSWAQNEEDEAQIDSLIEALDIQKSQVKDKIQPLETEAESIKKEQEKLNARLSQLETDKSVIQSEEVLTVDLRSIQSLFALEHGKCIIKSTDNPGEFLVQKGNSKIKFIIAPEDSSKRPTSKLTAQNVIHFAQPGWSESEPQQEIYRADVKMDRTSRKVIRSIFRGVNVEKNDDLVGNIIKFVTGNNTPPPAAVDITCII